MVEYRREQDPNGLNNLKKMVHKVTSVNLTFVEATGPVNDVQTPLFTRNVAVHSFGAQGSAVANQANIECLHRRRIAGPPHARGFCCTTQAGQGPGGWNATINSNFNMVGIFGPVIHADYPPLRESHFSSHSSAGLRSNALSNFIEDKLKISKAKYDDLKVLKTFCSAEAQILFDNLPHE
ncbi:unnamed protein product [Colias eurytheme]|nr:unnamed protein product [Colias eurytheme]